jgi:putative Mg2+ transporter-C (MgtC) family protein
MTWLNAIESLYTQWNDGLGWPTAAMVRLGLAAVLGAAIGLEREHQGHEAGFRTYALVCVGCALTMIVSLGFARVAWATDYAGGEAIVVDPARVAYGVMAGIGFLGAGSIIQARGHVRGLTTAAGIWCAAAVGLSAGLGQLIPAVGGTLVVLLFLIVLEPLGRRLPRERVALVNLALPWSSRVESQLREAFGPRDLAIRHVDVESVDPGQRQMHVSALVDCRHEDLLARVIASADEHEGWRLEKLRWVAD